MQTTVRTVTAAVVIIGNEILSGRTHDANLPYLSAALNAVGIRVTEARVVADD
ncbi:MAG TPA: molybdopterin-binding protein, partial [Rhodospirillales bacterium]|nr:molybdopterin-binding protein [Rhodospirillales bacterium]